MSNTIPFLRSRAEGIDLLLFVEDPSAANFVALLLPELKLRNWSTLLCAANVATGMLRARGIDFTEVDAATSARTLLERIRPKCVLTGTAENPDTLGLQLIATAGELGIASIAFVDARMNSEFRFCGHGKDPLAHAPDWLLVPDTWTLEAFIALGLARDRIAVCGHPQYDLVRDLAQQWERIGVPAFRSRIFPEVSNERRIVVFVSEGSLRYDLLPDTTATQYGLKGRGGGKGRTKIALEEVLDGIACVDERPYFVFRAHPIEDAGDYAEYAAEIDRISSEDSALELIYASDLVIGITSMLLLESALLGKRCLAVLPDAAEQDWLPGTESGLVPYATSREQIRLALTRLLQDDSPVCSVTGTSGFTFGAIQRTADFIAARLPRAI